MFKLTNNTDPSTVMFANHPNVKICRLSVTDKIIWVYPEVGSLLPEPSTGEIKPTAGDWFNQGYDENGINVRAYGRLPESRWGPIVSRLKFTTDKPIIATSEYGPTYTYEHVGTYTPTDGSEPVIHLKRTTKDSGYGHVVKVLASTGKVVTGESGSALTFSNGPEIRTYGDTLLSSGVGVNVTTTDGKITAISLA